VRVIAFIVIVVVLLGTGCTIPKSSGVQLTINGTKVDSVPWIDDDCTTVVWDPGISGEPAGWGEEQEAAYRSGPWYPWYLESDPDKLEIDCSKFPGEWDPAVHGLYLTSMTTEGTKWIFKRWKHLEANESTNNMLIYRRFDVLWNEGWDNWDTDTAGPKSCVLIILTPYKKGAFLVAYL